MDSDEPNFEFVNDHYNLDLYLNPKLRGVSVFEKRNKKPVIFINKNSFNNTPSKRKNKQMDKEYCIKLQKSRIDGFISNKASSRKLEIANLVELTFLSIDNGIGR